MKAIYQDFPVVLFQFCCTSKLVPHFSLLVKFQNVTIAKQAIEPYFFYSVFWHTVQGGAEFVNEIQQCEHSNLNILAVFPQLSF